MFKILIAEDDIMSQTLLKRVLTSWGYDVIVCNDSDEAWKAFQSDDAPQLAILDWMMPGMDGLDLCRKVRESGKEPYTYILILTAKTAKRDIATALENGADDYLSKPFNQDELKARIRAGGRILEMQEEACSST